MATYKMLGPNLAEVTHDSGQSIVLPLDEATAQAQGLQPAGLQLPSAPNPYSMIGSGQAVAGPGGGDPRDMGAGAGVFAQPGPAYGQGVPTPAQQVQMDAQSLVSRLQTPVPTSHESSAPRSKFDAPLPGELGGGPAAPPELVQVGSRAPQPSGRGVAGGGAPEVDPIVLEAMRASGGGGGRPHLGITSETRKYHENGPVDPELAAHIAAGQTEIDQQTSDSLEDQALHKGDYLEQQASLQQQQAQDVQAAMQRRQAVDNEIGRLQSRSEQAQQALMNAQPKQVDQFWQDKGTAVQIGAAIAMSLGAWAATIGGTENMGLKLVNQTIDRWMNDQIQQYNVTKDKATLANNAYRQAIDMYGSPELAQTNLQLQALAAKDALIKNQAEQIGTTDALGQAQLAMKETQQKRLELTALAQQQAGADVEAKLTMQGGGGGGNDVLARLKRGAQAKQALDTINGKDASPGGQAASKDARERQIRLPSGEIVWTNSAVKGKELQDVITGNMQGIDLGNQMVEILNNGAFTDLDKRKALKGLNARFLSSVSAAEKQGVVTKSDQELAESTLADPNAILSDGGAGLKATLGALKGGMQKHIVNNTYADPDATRPYGAPGASTFRSGL